MSWNFVVSVIYSGELTRRRIACQIWKRRKRKKRKVCKKKKRKKNTTKQKYVCQSLRGFCFAKKKEKNNTHRTFRLFFLFSVPSIVRIVTRFICRTVTRINIKWTKCFIVNRWEEKNSMSSFIFCTAVKKHTTDDWCLREWKYRNKQWSDDKKEDVLSSY